MKILVNLYNLTSGGGFTIGFGFIEELYQSDLNDEFIVIIPSKKLYPFENKAGIIFKKIPSFYTTWLGKIFLNQKLAYIAKKNKIEKILSFTNSAIPCTITQTLLIHWPYLVYSDKELWNKMTFLNRIKRQFNKYRIHKNIKFATTIVVQTEVMKSRLSLLVEKSKIEVIPAFHNFTAKNKGLKQQKIRKLVFVSNFYEHKNHEILIPLAQEMAKRKVDFQIYITINKNLPFAKKLKLYEKYIVNLGMLKPSDIEAIYPTFDGLFFPTLVETFGIPYLEAMHFSLPIFTSDRDFSRAVCGSYAHYFDPNNVSDILNVIAKYDFREVNQIPVFPSRKDVVKQLLEC